MPENKKINYITLQETAKLLGLKERRTAQIVKEGLIKGFKKSGKENYLKWFIETDSVQEYIKQKELNEYKEVKIKKNLKKDGIIYKKGEIYEVNMEEYKFLKNNKFI
jgi:O-glycosyl hydrolase